jgi:hypothetical protein
VRDARGLAAAAGAARAPCTASKPAKKSAAQLRCSGVVRDTTLFKTPISSGENGAFLGSSGTAVINASSNSLSLGPAGRRRMGVDAWIPGGRNGLSADEGQAAYRHRSQDSRRPRRQRDLGRRAKEIFTFLARERLLGVSSRTPIGRLLVFVEAGFTSARLNVSILSPPVFML